MGRKPMGGAGRVLAAAAACWRGAVALWMALGIVFLTLAAIELVPDSHFLWKKVLRLANPDGGKPDFRAAAEAYAGADWAPAYWREYMRNAEVEWDPAVLWHARPAEGRFVSVDAANHRRTEHPAQPQGRPVRVFMFGGSTMFGMGARDGHTIPSLVAARLGGGVPVEITNFGQPGWVMGQGVAELSEQLKRNNLPDIVVFYDGVNDVFSTHAQGRAGLPQNNDNRIREFNLTNPARQGALLREAVLASLDRTTALVKKLAPPMPPPVPQNQPPRESLADANAAYMAGNARQVRALAAAYGFRTVFALQPVIFSKTALSPFETKARADYQSMAAPYADAYAAIRDHRDFAATADFIDLSAALDGIADPLYVDFCHLGEGGNAVIADRLADRLRPLVAGAAK